MSDLEKLWFIAMDAVYLASFQVKQQYLENQYTVHSKSDQSPLTSADVASHHAIVDELSKTDFPILSEESEDFVDVGMSPIWIIDPIDGTKEFVARTHDFCICIGLLDKAQPVLGVIAMPMYDECYFAIQNKGAYAMSNFSKHWNPSSPMDWGQIKMHAQKLPVNKPTGAFKLLISRSHQSYALKEYIQRAQNQHQNLQVQAMGSAYKFCLLAKGDAHEIPRFSPMMLWDFAAAHSIINESGLTIQCWETPIDYQSKDKEIPQHRVYWATE